MMPAFRISFPSLRRRSAEVAARTMTTTEAFDSSADRKTIFRSPRLIPDWGGCLYPYFLVCRAGLRQTQLAQPVLPVRAVRTSPWLSPPRTGPCAPCFFRYGFCNLVSVRRRGNAMNSFPFRLRSIVIRALLLTLALSGSARSGRAQLSRLWQDPPPSLSGDPHQDKDKKE